MATVTSPIILDSTGQDIKTSIDLLTANINRTASNIPYDNNLTIKGKIDAINLTSGGNIVNPNSTSVTNDTRLYIGNNIPNGTTGSSRGVLYIYGKEQYSGVLFVNDETLTADRYYSLPNKTGIVALTSDIKNIQSLNTYTKSSSVTVGNYPTDKPFWISVAMGSGNSSTLWSLFVPRKEILNRRWNLTGSYYIYFNTSGAFDFSALPDGAEITVCAMG